MRGAKGGGGEVGCEGGAEEDEADCEERGAEDEREGYREQRWLCGLLAMCNVLAIGLFPWNETTTVVIVT